MYRQESVSGPPADVSPFQISVPDGTITDLHERLRRTRFPDEVVGETWDYGFNPVYMRELVDYWLNEYDWSLQQRTFNAFPQFTTAIDGLDIHFIHVRGTGPNPVPIILTHGWPSTFTEMLRIIPMLTDPASHGGNAHESFDVVVPSVPGYGFSSRPKTTGLVPVHTIWAKLMERLGYQKFVAQGGDIGSGITTNLARFHGERLIGIHLQAVQEPYRDASSPELSDAEIAYLERRAEWTRTEGAYSAEQRTKPQTLSYGLNDSPVGLAAWMIEKFRTWSDCAGDVERRFSKDELLNNVMIYWIGQTIGSSIRYYYEWANHHVHLTKDERIKTPTAVAIFPKDLSLPPREWVERAYNVQRYTTMPRGGHFAAHEEPLLLAQELREFVYRDITRHAVG